MTVFKRICKCCGAEFETNRVNKIYCTSKCTNKVKIRKKRGITDSDYTKVCPVCGKHFQAFRRTEVFCCRACYRKNYAIINKDRLIEKSRTYRETNKDQIKERKKKYYEDNKDLISQKGKVKYRKSRAAILEKAKVYYKENTARVKERTRDYAKKHKQERLSKSSTRYKEDANFRLSIKCRDMINRCLSQKKKSRTQSILGYTSDDLKVWVESQFYNNMCWENYNLWEIHHIKPLCTFNFVNEDGTDNYDVIKEANALSNLIPLYIEDHKRLTNLYLSEKKWLTLKEIQELIIMEKDYD